MHFDDDTTDNPMTFTLGRSRGDLHETSGLGSGFDHKSFARKRREICVVRAHHLSGSAKDGEMKLKLTRLAGELS